MSDSPLRLLIVCNDLFFSTQLRSAAERAGAEVDLELQGSQAAAHATAERYDVVVIDLESPGLNLQGLMASLKEGSRPRVIGFGPHVQEQRLTAAREAGCDQVVSRGRIAVSLPQFLRNGRK